MSHWLETAKYVTDGCGAKPTMLGEGEDGELYVPSRDRLGCWDRRYSPRNPRHWRFWLRSRLTRTVAFLSQP